MTFYASGDDIRRPDWLTYVADVDRAYWVQSITRQIKKINISTACLPGGLVRMSQCNLHYIVQPIVVVPFFRRDALYGVREKARLNLSLGNAAA